VAKILFSISTLNHLVKAQIIGQLQYRISFTFDLLGTLFITLTEFASLALVLPLFDGIGGWQLGDIALLYGTVNLAFGLMDMIFSGFDPGNFGRQIRMGLMDQILLRPAGVITQVLGSAFELRRLGRISIGFLILLLSITQSQIIWTSNKILVLFAAILGQIAYFGGLFIIGATISFWTIGSIEIINVFTYGGTELVSYPMHIYPDTVRKFFTYILPAIFLNYYPALYILDKPDPYNFPNFSHWLAPIAGLIILALALRFWQFGITHYQSTGT
jgi:ABC-2 type transport system permease protein